MKSCPTCNRTFEDNLTFCLADGSLLSAPFDPRRSQPDPATRRSDQLATEVMNAAVSTSSLPTQPAVEANFVTPTIASPPPPPVESRGSGHANSSRPAVAWSIHLLAVIAGLAVSFPLRLLGRFLYGSKLSYQSASQLFLVLNPLLAVLVYGSVGVIFGYAWSQKGWKWGLWIVVTPWLFVAFLTLPYVIKGQPSGSALWVFVFSYLVLAPVAACIGSSLGTKLSLKKTRR